MLQTFILAILLALTIPASRAAGSSADPPAADAAAREDLKRLDHALRELAPQRRGVVDAYVLSLALDGDPVFSREARVAADVLRRRYGADGRTLVLAGSTEDSENRFAHGSPANLARALERISQLVDSEEDVLILYSTSHGLPTGLGYRYPGRPTATVSPLELKGHLERLGLRNRLLIISACYSGIFIPVLQSPESLIVTAASRSRTSFGCVADSDWTFFGDAMINRALRKPHSIGAAFSEASGLVSDWEGQFKVAASQPQIYIGSATPSWLGPLEQRVPTVATRPTGRPAIETSAMNLRSAAN